MLKSLFLMGAVCGGAKVEGDKVIMTPEQKKKEPEKTELKPVEEKKSVEKESDRKGVKK